MASRASSPRAHSLREEGLSVAVAPPLPSVPPSELPVLVPYFTPPPELAAGYRMHPALSEGMTPEELDENFLLLDEHAYGTEEQLVRGCLDIPYRNLVTLVAYAGTGKSYLAADLALSVAAGRPFLGQETRPGTVLYIDFEQNRREMKKRLDKLAREAEIALPALASRLHYRNFTEEGSSFAAVQSSLLTLAEQYRPDLIVVDSWGTSMGIDSNDEHAVNQALTLLKPFLRYGTVLTLAHPSQNDAGKPANQLRPSGHSQQRNQPRRVYGLAKGSGRHHMRFGVSKTNGSGELWVRDLYRIDTLDGEGLKHVLQEPDEVPVAARLGVGAEASQPTETLQLIKDTVNERGQISREDMQALLQERGLTKSMADRALREGQLKPIAHHVKVERDPLNPKRKLLVRHEPLRLLIA